MPQVCAIQACRKFQFLTIVKFVIHLVFFWNNGMLKRAVRDIYFTDRHFLYFDQESELQ